MERVIFEGIAGQEIVAAMLVHRIPRKDWPEVFAGVRAMARAALPVLNEKR